jgi:hypothetical protein
VILILREQLEQWVSCETAASREGRKQRTLESLTMKRLVKNLKDLECAVMRRRVHEFGEGAITCNYHLKWSINPIINQNPVYSHNHTRDNIIYQAV